MFEESWTKELLIVLATAGVIVPLFGRFRVGVVPGFLLAGVMLGPAGLGRLADDYPWLSAFTFSTPEHVQPFAELGVLFLLFVIGLEFSLERLWSMRRLVLGLGSGQFFGSVALILAGVALLGVGLEPALVAGLALALSSTAIVTQVLIEAHRFAAPVGRISIGVLLFQDLMVVPIVIVVGLMGGDELAVSGAVSRAVALAVAALAIIALAARYLVGPLLRLAGATGNRELVVAIALFLAIGTAAMTGAVGLSPALGAFLAGLLLGESEYRHQLEVDIEPFKGLLLGIFFMTVGMSLDLMAIGAAPASYLGAVLALIIAKFLIVALVARLFGIALPVAVESGFVLAGAGEFAFVAFTLAYREEVIDPDFHQFAVSVAALSMIAIPGLAILGRKFGTALQDRSANAIDGVDGIGADHVLTDHIVIGGLGRVGQAVARVLEAEQIPYVAVDTKADLVSTKRRAGEPVFFGDASRREILEKLGGANARAFVVTTDKPEAAERMVKAILKAWPKATIHARALDMEHARKLSAIGVRDVVPEALEGSLQLAGRVLAGIGLPDDAIDARLDVAREAEIRRLASGET
jgi:monovalent cation:proton antiporter-2 (CPA2) family protein